MGRVINETDRIIHSLSIAKTLSIGSLAILSGILGTIADTIPRTMVALNASILVLVVALSYGSHDNLPHGRYDILSACTITIIY